MYDLPLFDLLLISFLLLGFLLRRLFLLGFLLCYLPFFWLWCVDWDRGSRRRVRDEVHLGEGPVAVVGEVIGRGVESERFEEVGFVVAGEWCEGGS